MHFNKKLKRSVDIPEKWVSDTVFV